MAGGGWEEVIIGLMPRFVILKHELPAGQDRSTHYDLMLEQDGVLRTWACETFPGNITAAQRIADHRLAYLDYEGPISGERGTVTRLESGACEWLADSENGVLVRLMGSKLIGTLTLAIENEGGQRWRVTFEPG